jgi:hypothetical protein
VPHIPKPKISEYSPPYGAGKCTSSLALIPAEIRYVDETPSITWWWEDVILPADHEVNQCLYAHRDKNYKGETHRLYCYPDFPDKSKRITYCGLESDHNGPHMSEIGICEEDLSKDIWISWRTGQRDSRELKQPGMCKAERTPNDSVFFCLLAEGHGGKHLVSDGFVNDDWELVN